MGTVSSSKIDREIDYLNRLKDRIVFTGDLAEKFIDWAKRVYIRLDCKRYWLIPLSIIAMLAFTLLLILPAGLSYTYGIYLNLCAARPALGMMVERCLSAVWHLLYCMGLCVVTHLLFIYFGWEQLFFQLLNK